ncbi:MBL fold metallo-hydrolase [Actinoplanes sp. NBRC 14428]|uniref:L-ascorbate metabolism protein UlaG (Beta-lactamase superfamily) n=1 Tax=Pseudosporangium ferrugineum TaxID=439699 RepID=A0A2T0RD35_9ACTN|nr:MBL fold metallo-hydrolase [Pseudosporangium ferrugineum]PRY19020.1 L-ascorbate metabolism protein UlaG (beta-lactamase superfamily) [Pseudosporangium ferrugineum]BCJ53466.1 MBL fold metallo-hydrolase [Actinoplanes sp. NBRC 14428]
MRLTKHVHAAVVIEEAGQRILIDPGTFTPDAADLLESATSVLITHEHFDHFAADEVRAALTARSELRLWGPASVTAALEDTDAARAGRVMTVRGGEALDVDGIDVRVYGGDHGQIHEGIPVPHNVGYLVGGRVFHPGDSYAAPLVPVDTLLVPVSGPWVKVGDAIDFISAVAPRQTVPIHDVMLSEIGRASTGRFLGEKGLTATPMLALEPGESVEI